MENSRRCGICSIDFHRASFAKHLGIKKHLEVIRQNELIIPLWFFQEPIENKIYEFYNPRLLREKAGDIFKMNDKQLNNEVAKKMLNP